MFGAIFSGIGGSSRYSLYVQNLDANASGQPTELSTSFIEALNSTETFEITEVPADVNATGYVREKLGPLGGNMRVLVISRGFQDDLLNGTLKVRIGIIYDTIQYFKPYMTEEQNAVVSQGLL